jgi:CheY-like chemotaxis protein
LARVLIVDDDDEVRSLMARILEMDGHTALTAVSVRDAREVLARHPKPAMALIDIDMPGETGVELVIELRQQEAWAKTPILFVTAYPERSRPLQATKLGAQAVITKPFRLTDVRMLIAQHVGERGETSWNPG